VPGSTLAVAVPFAMMPSPSMIAAVRTRLSCPLSVLVLSWAPVAAQPAVPEIPPLPPPAPVELTAEVFDALAAIEQAQATTYGTDELHRIFHAIWWDLAYSPAEENLARQLKAPERPAEFTCVDGRTLAFTKTATAAAGGPQRFLLVSRYTWKDSSYFVQAFRMTKDAGLFIGACRVHENAAEIMEAALVTMVNEARFAGRNTGDAPLLQLLNTLETSHREANPGIRAEFADVVRRVLAKFDRVPPEIRDAAWLAQ
jgi:hypothetical protein